MRIVLDTNVLVSGMLNPAGPPGRIVTGLVAGDLRLVCDDRILAEYRDVLARPRLRLDPVDVAVVLGRLAARADLVAPAPMAIGLPDPDDEAFIEAAAAGHADALVTGNFRHFPPERCLGVLVIAPVDFVRRWAAA